MHAKDTLIDPVIAGINGIIDTTPGSEVGKPGSANHVTLGRGRDEAWWSGFIAALRTAGYDGALSIEHEDPAQSPEEGVEESVALLRWVLGAGLAPLGWIERSDAHRRLR